MFKQITPTQAAAASRDHKGPASASATGSDQAGLLRAQFSAELAKLLAQMVVLR